MKTAIEWLLDNLKGQLNIDEATEVINQAKEMEKEQLIEAYHSGINLEYHLDMRTPIDYYNETYGGNKLTTNYFDNQKNEIIINK